MDDRFDGPDVAEEFVAEPFAFARSFDQTCYITEFYGRIDRLFGIIDVRQIRYPLVRNSDDSYVRLYRAEGVI